MDLTMSTNVLLTERDCILLKALYDNTVMTYGQIKMKVFPEVKKTTAINRLTKLLKVGLISRQRVARIRLGNDPHAIGVLYQITKSGIQWLIRRYPLITFRPEPVRVHFYTLEHDLLVVDLMAQLKKEIPGVEIVNGKLWESGTNANGLVPDLILKKPNSNALTAIELELNVKSEKRYRELILKYRMAGQFEKVIYFVGHESIQATILRTILGRPLHPQEKPEIGKFEFRSFHFGPPIAAQNEKDNQAIEKIPEVNL